MRGLEKLTQNAVKAVKSAYDFANGIKSPELTIEHLLIGLLSVKAGMAYKVVGPNRLDVNKLIEEVGKKVVGKVRPDSAELKIGDDFKEALQKAFRIANGMRHVYVGTEHLLLAVLAQKDHSFVKNLKDSGVEYKDVKKKVASLVQYPEGILTESEDEESGSILDFLGTNLSKLASQGKLDPVIGRDEEIERVVNILARRTKNNPVIVGDPGVGKTAIVEGLAQKMVRGEVSSVLLGYEIWMLDTASIVAGSRARGEMEAKMLALLDEIEQRKNVILFIDEIHNILGAGAVPGGMSIASILKPALAKGKINCIGATTSAEYSGHFEEDPGFSRRFQPVFVEEMSIEDTVEILKGLKPVYEAFHEVTIPDETLETAAKLSKRFITDRYLPDKAVDLVDEACARVRVGKLYFTPKYRKLIGEIRKTYFKKRRFLESGDYEKAANQRDKQDGLWKDFEKYRKRMKKKWKGKKRVVDEEKIRTVINDWTGIPVETISTSEAQRVLGLKNRLKKRVVGQKKAIKSVVNAVKRARAGVVEQNRPFASLLFLGPTGVGKTELAKRLADQLFGDTDSFIQVDMSEMMESHSVSKLIGAPPGYIGYDQGGQLTERLWKRPYSVVLFDEIEKAHDDVLNVLLQVLEEGHLTDGRGRKVSFKNAVIIMTSNIGAEEIGEDEEIGFKISKKERLKSDEIDEAYKDMEEKIRAKLKEQFRPEFLNRIDDIVIFRALTMKEVEKIVDIQLGDLNDRMKEKEIQVEVSDKLRKKIAEEGYSETYGARPVKRQIQERVEAPLADYLLRKRPDPGSNVMFDIKKGKIVASRQRGKE